MKLNLKKVKHFDFFLATQIVLMSFTCLVNLAQSQLNLPQHDYDYYDHTGVNVHTHHHHHSPNTHILPVNPYRHHRKPTISNRHNWISGTFYNQENFKGLPMAYYFSGKSCVNFPLYQRMSSLKPYGCVMLFKYQDCQGPVSMAFESMPNLHAIGMSEGIASIKNCLSDNDKPIFIQPNLLQRTPMRFPLYKKK